MRNLRFIIELGLTKLGLVTIGYLPRGCVVRLARALGWCGYHLAGHLRKTAWANIDIAMGDTCTTSRKRAILIHSFQSFTLVLLDLFWFGRRTKERIETYVHMDPIIEKKLKETDALVCISAHSGNWELFGKSISMRGYPLLSVAAPLANTRVDEIFNQIRTETGQRVVHKNGAVRHMLKQLKDGGKIAVLLDQNTKPSDGGMFVSFFGKPVTTSTIAAVMAMRTGAVLGFATCIPDKHGHYSLGHYNHIAYDDIPAGNKVQQIQTITQRIISVIEEDVRAYPDNWLWMYKRWKYVAIGDQRENYPFYAKCMLEHDQAEAQKHADELSKGEQ